MRLAITHTETALRNTLATICTDWDALTVTMSFPNNSHSLDMAEDSLAISPLCRVLDVAQSNSPVVFPSAGVEKHSENSTSHEEVLRIRPLFVAAVQRLLPIFLISSPPDVWRNRQVVDSNHLLGRGRQ